jgi:hypothetical protein
MTKKIKKLLLGIAALGALAFGGAQLAGGAQGNGQAGTPAAEQSEPAEQPGSKANEKGEKADGAEKAGGESSDQVTGPDAEKAKAAALAEVGSGKVTDVSAENHAKDAGEKADAPEKGETPDPAYESQIAYDVEVTKADGSVVDVHLDKQFKVLGTEKAHQNSGGDHENGAEQSKSAEQG